MEIELKVAESHQRDVDRKIARIDPETYNKLGIISGNIISITGKRTTYTIAWPAYPEDEGMGIIRVDGTTRENAGISIGDKVKVKKALKISSAKKILLSPSQPIKFDSSFVDYVRQILVGFPFTKGDKFRLDILGSRLIFTVVSCSPSEPAIVGIDTIVDIKEVPSEVVKERIPEVRYEDIGGLKEQLAKIREMIELPLKHPELFEHLGIEPPKGVLLYGPPGTGKTLIAKAVANEAGAHFISIAGPEIMSKWYGESEKRLREIFEEAEQNAPSIVFIDEIDAVAPKREEVTGEVERRVVAQLLSLMDGLKSRGKVVVIAATNRVNAVDPALRRPGRFDREIEIGVPNKSGRKEILQIHTRGMPLAKDINLDEFSDITHGFVGADLAALCRESAMKALRRVLPEIDLEQEKIPTEILTKIKVTKNDFMNAFTEIEPSALREVYVEVPEVTWEDVGGLSNLKQELKEAVEWPLKRPDAFKKIGIKPPRGILLFGPPGTGKTLLAKAVANESEANFIAVSGPSLMSKWVGESEKSIRDIFRRAREAAPSIIFIDELDSIAPRRGSGIGDSHVTERMVNQLLSEMDGIQKLENVVIMAATNRVDIIDPGLLRPGRFDRILYVLTPDKETRLEIFKIHTKNMSLAEDVDLKLLAERTEGYTGADIEGVCREAGMLALRENMDADKVEKRHFEKALLKVKPSLAMEIEKEYQRLFEKFQKESEIASAQYQ